MAATLELSSLSLFSREMRKAPRLDRAEETRLARLWRDQGDREAARQLVVANLSGVAAIAREYRHFGLPEMDLIQEGTLGLMHAVKGFDPERGFRLMTYASWWVRAAIHEFILHSWSIVKLGTNKLQRRIFAGLQKAKNAIAALDGSKADDVGADFGISGAAYQEAAGAFLQRDLSLDYACDEDGDAMVHGLPSLDASPEEIVAESNWADHQQTLLSQAMGSLPARDRLIIQRRHLADEPATLKELSEEFGVSMERIRQIEARAMFKLRESMGAQ
ncbi:MAG: RNA polymerase subunit sigma-70 [Zetaproteobacteria bacterium CG12_big_fil_rev_8_21_14_0_65_54_13]|nr:MAG: RNA polymerase subunit sigma-70 [Zetaproteobacteria bacterium CG23_combo_of_CG06-09_8_20_14_all_54_7]PIW48774.1 MAG: RNA polymerase subunit sigma-70 [Zetaproteobacteria bacterium CG12_big_fil_rev_8_21_14_0_65_54_13]PIX53576.1 MAG: RNA polymerase subunit sigma-70 [Zetaproteobacteria bacterium CG_4_10_14_3_um_filter_54_28]PJA31117.1 MAG: RNA polymerase subunit sigma-70 [Zetaproteobacteria bacterium CG_4_9_14_3_um_filter_54_145]